MIYLKSVLVFCFLLSGCDYIKLAKGVSNDSDLNFRRHKQYLVSLPLIGELIEKNICVDCNYNKYRIKIKLNNFNVDTVNIGFRSYEPFYNIEDNKISLSVNEKIYSDININTKLIKKSHSKYLGSAPIDSDKATKGYKINDLRYIFAVARMTNGDLCTNGYCNS